MWSTIASAPENQLVMTKIDEGGSCRNEQPMSRSGRLWFIDNGGTYVYYTPTHWRPLSIAEKLALKNEAERKAIAALKQAEKMYS